MRIYIVPNLMLKRYSSYAFRQIVFSTREKAENYINAWDKRPHKGCVNEEKQNILEVDLL